MTPVRKKANFFSFFFHEAGATLEWMWPGYSQNINSISLLFENLGGQRG